jgi:hypothetical protein
MIDPPEPIQLDPPTGELQLGEDRRPKLEVPPPVRMIAVEDCVLYCPAGLERQLDEFYVGLLGFEREDLPSEQTEQQLVYRAQNFRLRIEVLERPVEREDFRPLTLVVESISDLVHRLSEAEVEFQRQRGLTPGQDNLLLSDPAGNPVSVGEYRIAI